MHPETKPTKAGGRNRRQGGDDVARFTADTAAKTGKPERTVQRDATRAKALGADLDRVAGTSLDKGAELDALPAEALRRQSSAPVACVGPSFAVEFSHQRWTKPGARMNRLQKFVEQGAYGEWPGRTAYAFTATVLPEPKNGFDWRPVGDFSAADEVLHNPDLKEVFEAAIKRGYAVVSQA